jgi:broad specificity phosphatase PhoE
LKIYYVRHAEGGHQLVDEWAGTPKHEWPDHVGNGDMLTPAGKAQAAALAARLLRYPIDFVAVSPFLRCQQTIMPYLNAARVEAEVWPELAEVDGRINDFSWSDLPAPNGNMRAGKPILVLDHGGGCFNLRRNAGNWFEFGTVDAQAAANYHAFVCRAITMITERFGSEDRSILLVGHNEAGKHLLQSVLNDAPHYASVYGSSLRNTGMWMVELTPNDGFQLRILNDEPYPIGTAGACG